MKTFMCNISNENVHVQHLIRKHSCETPHFQEHYLQRQKMAVVETIKSFCKKYSQNVGQQTA